MSCRDVGWDSASILVVDGTARGSSTSECSEKVVQQVAPEYGLALKILATAALRRSMCASACYPICLERSRLIAESLEAEHRVSHFQMQQRF